MIKVGIGEYDTGWRSPEVSLGRAHAQVRQAAAAGARLVVLPETCAAGFTVAAADAEPLDGPAARVLATAARENRTWVLAGLATLRDGRCYNSALLFDPKGDLVGGYDKQRPFAFAGEDREFSAGHGPMVCAVEGVRLTVFICYDLRFPQLFQESCPEADLAVVIANWPEARQAHWELLTQARAVENQVYVIGCNRTGEAGGLAYRGGSTAFLPDGKSLLPSASPGLVEVDPRCVTELRTRFPVVPDRRSLGKSLPFAPTWLGKG